MIAVPEPLQNRLGLLALDVLRGGGPGAAIDAVALAADLIAAGIDDTAVVDVAILEPEPRWAESEHTVRRMLARVGHELPRRASVELIWSYQLRAFADWGLPFADFYPDLVRHLPDPLGAADLNDEINGAVDSYFATDRSPAHLDVMRSTIRRSSRMRS